MLSGIKQWIFKAAPVAWQRKFILRKTGHQVFKNEAIDGVNIEMAISPSKLWEKRLSEKNGHEPGICTWLRDNLKAGDVFFDIGSLFGFFPVLVNSIQPKVPVHAFEMNWFSIHYMKLNEALTMKRTGSAPWHINECMVSDLSSGDKVSIDDYAEKHKAFPTVIKMDIDGGEVLAMRGMKRLIARGNTTWLIEIHPRILAGQQQSFDDILELIPDSYSVRYLPLIREDNLSWTTDRTSFDNNEEFYVCISPVKTV